MNTPLRDQWIEQCAKRLMELQPVLRPRVAHLAAKDLWDEEQGLIPPDRRAQLEVMSWGRQGKPQVRSQLAVPVEASRGVQAGHLLLDLGLNAVLLVAILGVWVFPW